MGEPSQMSKLKFESMTKVSLCFKSLILVNIAQYCYVILFMSCHISIYLLRGNRLHR